MEIDKWKLGMIIKKYTAKDLAELFDIDVDDVYKIKKYSKSKVWQMFITNKSGFGNTYCLYSQKHVASIRGLLAQYDGDTNKEKIENAIEGLKCGKTRRKKLLVDREYIYFIRCNNNIKIGYSADVQKRLKDLQTGNPYTLQLVSYFLGSKEKEAELHEKFNHLKVNGEWFKYTDEIKEFIKEQKEKRTIEKKLKWLNMKKEG